MHVAASSTVLIPTDDARQLRSALHGSMQPKPARRLSGRLRPVIAAVLVTLLCAFWLRGSNNADGWFSSAIGSGGKRRAFTSCTWPKVRRISGLETLWELPRRKAVGVLFVAHGCSHAGRDFWHPSACCTHCLGLPEEVAVREAALKRRYAVVAVTSFNRTSGCWQNTQPQRSEDLKRLPGILRTVIEEEALQNVPLFVLGASSGGSQVLRLAAIMPEIKGVISQITPVNPSTLEVEGGGRRFPPTLFIHMAERDPGKAKSVAVALEVLNEAGVPAAEVRISPRPVTAAFLRRAHEISRKRAQSILAALKDGGFLDKGGYLMQNPRSGGWREAVQPVAGGLSLQADESPVAELLNVAYARHEIVSDYADAALAWLEAGGKEELHVKARRRRRRYLC